MSYKDERQFGLLFAGVFILAAFWPLWPLHAPNYYWLGAAGASAAVGLLIPHVLAPLYKAWMVLGHALGWLNARIILGAVFFVIVTPIALMMKLFRRNLLMLRPMRDGYWIKRGANVTPQSMRDQF